ncbi:MAG: sigma 54-interacting transcriptional regulator, partial [Deltaproteobacteria bacterium]|nr:sigma 54-interacting transcriptional regulator [Deltaproteobacteria bacterium]
MTLPRLSANDQSILQLAAALEGGLGYFGIDGLLAFLPLKPSEVLAGLENLKKLELVEDFGRERPSDFRFSRDFWKTADSRAGIGEASAEVHRQLADYFAKEMPPGINRNTKVAWHHERAGQIQSAVPLWHEAVGQLIQGHRTDEAVLMIGKSLNALLNLKRTHQHNKFFLELFVLLAENGPVIKDAPRTELIVSEVETRAKAGDPSPLAIRALLFASFGLIGAGRLQWLESLCRQAQAMAQELNHAESLKMAGLFQGAVHYIQGNFKAAVELYESTLDNTENLPNDPVSLGVCILLAHCYALTGRIPRALGMVNAIMEAAKKTEREYIIVWAQAVFGSILLETGRLDEAKEVLDRLSTAMGFQNAIFPRAAYYWGMAYIHFHQGTYREMTPYLEKLYSPGMRFGNFYNPSGIEVTSVLARMEPIELEAMGLSPYLDKMKKMLQKGGRHPAVKGLVAYHTVMNQYQRGKLTGPKTIKGLTRAEELLAHTDSVLALARVRAGLAGVYLDIGQPVAAREALLPQTEVLNECGAAVFPRRLRDLIGPESPEKLLLKAVGEISRCLGAVLDRDSLIQRAIETINRITGAERGGLFLYGGEERGSRRLLLQASRGLSEESLAQPAFAPFLNWIHQVAETGAGGIKKSQSGVTAGSPTVALCAPLILRDRIVGVVYQDNLLVRTSFRQEDVTLIQAFATQLAAALENARAFEEIERLNKRLKEENEYYEEEDLKAHHYGEIVAVSKPMLKALGLIDKVVRTDIPVLILGETGVGKELVARSLHQRSPRSNRPFIRVNCAILPEGLIISELFGHEKGAFTGAEKTRPGRFELADQGTIFLDEVGELPPDAQAKFLRVLQEGEFERIGGAKTFNVDIRVVAATNRNLKEEVASGRFRADLFYRLNTFPINVPPLRDRKEDIPPLAYYFLANSGRKLGKTFDGIPKKEMSRLFDYPWPGNVRELKHVIERSAILAPPGKLRIHLPDEPQAVPGGMIWHELDAVEREYILKV